MSEERKVDVYKRQAIDMDEENKKFTLAGKEFHEGDYISIRCV